MKQSALVIATLFATAEAMSAKDKMNRDIRGYLHNGLKFDTKVIEAVHEDQVRVNKAWNQLKGEARENVQVGHEVMDKYGDAISYEESQMVVTKPSKANGEWGNIHYNNPQKIMDKWAAAVEADQDNGEEWGEDFQRYGEQINRSHEILGKKVTNAWNKNGVKAGKYFQSGLQNAGQAWEEDRVNAPHSLAGVNSQRVAGDFNNFTHAVGEAHHAVRETIRDAQRADAGPDRRIDQANYRYTKERLEIAKGYNKAIEFEIKNTHFERGAPGGEGGLSWSNKQQIVDKWATPVEQSQKARAQWRATLEKNMEEKMRIQQQVKAEAQKVWPAKFAKVEKTWNELAANFNNGPHSLAASQAQVKAGLDNVAEAGWAMDKAVIDDFITYNNDTVDQRRQFKSDVKTYIEQKKVINQQYAAAWNYEMENIHFKNTNGRWAFSIDNKDTIIDKWTDAQANDIAAREELKSDFINYQNSISAEKAAFKATAQAQWPKKFEAYKAAVIDFDQTIGGPQERAAQRAAVQPHSLITDVQQHEAELIRGQVYDNINERAQLKWDIKQDLKAYLEDTNGARAALKKEEQEWVQASKQVQDMYAAAWNYQVAQTKYTPATDKHAATFELQNAKKVSNNWRAAAQADQDLGQDIQKDLYQYHNQVAPAKKALKNEINSQWIPQAEKINQSDVFIVEEVMRFPSAHANKTFDAFHQAVHANTHDIRKPHFTHPYHNLMAVESSSSLSTNEQIAYGTVFLMAMIAVAALSNKGKAESKSVEFDVEDLEMTNKKESKKQIKKTLKDIMKTSNTKVTLMNN